MKKIQKIIFVIFLFFFPPIVHLAHFIFDNGVGADSIPGCKIIVLKFIEIIMNNFEFYATCFSIFWAVEAFFKEEKELNESIAREKEKLNKEIEQRKKKDREIKNKEIETYKDSFRPNFVLSEDSRKLILIMKNDDYYLENVRYYKSTSDEGKLYITLGHKMEIDLEGAINNYFITAETLIGEKIIFGIILNNLKIYKLLKENESPILPTNFTGKVKEIEEKIKENWITFNENSIKSASEKSSEVDINFMYKTVAIREKMALNITEHMKNIISRDTVKSLFETTLINISTNKYEFNENMRKKVIFELVEILQENLDTITINPCKIPENIWKYINKKTDVKNEYNDNKAYAANHILSQYSKNINTDEIDNIITIFLKLLEYTSFCNNVDNSIEMYKARILECIEN